MIFLDPLYKLFFQFHLVIFYFYEIGLHAFFFPAFLSIRLSKSYAYGHGVGRFIWVNFDIFLLLFFSSFMPNIFLLRIFLCCFLGSVFYIVIIGLITTITSFKNSHLLTLVISYVFFIKKSISSSNIFLELAFVLFFLLIFFSMRLSQSCFHDRDVSELILVDSDLFHWFFYYNIFFNLIL